MVNVGAIEGRFYKEDEIVVLRRCKKNRCLLPDAATWPRRAHFGGNCIDANG